MQRDAGPGSPPPAGPAAGAWLRTLAVGLFPVLLIGLHTYVWSTGFQAANVTAWRRMWSDLAVAIASYVDATQGPPEGIVAGGAEADRVIRRFLLLRFQDGTLTPDRPLTTVGRRELAVRRVAPTLEPYDDKGRSALLALVFRVRGGVAPFLILWLGALLAAPVLAWAALEMQAAGWTRAALVVPLVLGLSPFVVETLALARYPVGFYVVAVLLVLPLAAYAVLRHRPTVRGVAVRALAGAILLGVCVFCRSSSATLMPAFVLASGIGLARAGLSRRAVMAGTLAAAVLFGLPSALVPGGQQHDVWQPVWEGLGDFDRTHGFTWNDDVAAEVVKREGAPDLWTAESEAVFRRQVTGAIRDDPAWFAGILLKRAAATTTLWKLWPWGPTSGQFIRIRTTPNEGVMDKYWTYTTTLDHFGMRDTAREVPVVLLVAPALVLGALAIRSHRQAAARQALLLLACLGVGTLALPVLITTAGGQEAQSFGITYLVAFGLLADVLRRPAAD